MELLSKSRLYVDALTGLSNFFQLIETEPDELFGQEGTFIIFDFIHFTSTNEVYGRDIGDLCLKEFADNLRHQVADLEDAKIFRMGGDEFILILSPLTDFEAKKLLASIEITFRETMDKLQVKNNGLHSFYYTYSEPLTLSDFLQTVGKKTWAKRENTGEQQKNWAEQMIMTLVYRIKETINLYNDAYELALTDDISELPNHRSAQLYLEHILKADGKKKFSLFFIDGDNLKKFNTISYQAGNEMIKELSAVIQSALRNGDKVFRWLSGDEFIVILENIKDSEVSQLAERVRATVEKKSHSWHYPVTISIGVANYPEDADSIEELIKKAEEANSYAKSQGKNRVISYCNIHN